MPLRKPNEILPLEIARDINRVAELTGALVMGEMPGFQIDPENIDKNLILKTIRGVVKTRIPAFNFNDTLDSVYADSGGGLHYDPLLRGVAVHENFGEGLFRIRATKPREYEREKHYPMENNDFASMGKGPWYEGTLGANRRFTVFVENMMRETGVSPALHRVLTTGTNSRLWQRHAFDPLSPLTHEI